MASARRSVFYLAGANAVSIGTTLILLIVVTRWLDAAQIGAFAIALAILLLIEPLRDFKLIEYVQHCPSADAAVMGRVNALIVLTTGLSLIAVLALVAVIASLNPQSLVAPLLAIGAVSLLMRGCAQPAEALLSRAMRFGPLSAAQWMGALAKLIVTICGLWLGWGAFALMVGVTAQSVCRLGALMYVYRRLALAPPRFSQLSPIVRYCAGLSLVALLTRGFRSASELVIGIFLGLAPAGLYNRANGLVAAFRNLIERGVVPIAMSSFSDANRAHPNAVAPKYLRSLSLITATSAPAFAVLLIMAEPLIALLYGPRWLGIVTLSQWLALAGILTSFAMFAGPALAASGAVRALVARALIVQVPSLIVLCIAAQISFAAIGPALAASRVIDILANWAAMKRHLGVSFAAIIGAIGPSLPVIGAAFAAAFLARWLAADLGAAPIMETLITGGAGAGGWLIAILICHSAMRDEFTNLARSLKNRDRAAGQV